MLKRILKVIKRNIVPFVIGAVVFSGITYAVAATIQSSNVTYTTNINSSVTNVKQAVDDLYGKVSNSVQFKYWNSNFDGTSYDAFTLLEDSNNQPIPTNVYNSRELLVSAYGTTNFNNNPFYIKSVTIGEKETAYLVCIYYNNKEMCLDPYYDMNERSNDNNITFMENVLKTNLDNDIKQNLGIVNPYCSTNAGSDSESAVCYFNNSMTIGCERMYDHFSGRRSSRISCFTGSFGSPEYVNYGGTTYCIKNCDTNGDGIPDKDTTYNKIHSCDLSVGTYREIVTCK